MLNFLVRPQRLLHSEAYIKYIEGLNKVGAVLDVVFSAELKIFLFQDSRSMCNWDRQLNANSEVNISAEI